VEARRKLAVTLRRLVLGQSGARRPGKNPCNDGLHTMQPNNSVGPSTTHEVTTNILAAVA
jgi:hypothetical protein